MKICILSMQRVPNFGSLLQGYALKTILEQQGHDVSFLDIEPNMQDNDLLGGKMNSFPREGEARGTLFAKLKKLDRYTLNRLTNRRLSRLQNTVFEDFRRKELGICGNKNHEKFDCCVIGSDEVFNCLSGAPWGFTTQLFGNVPQARKVITYAASCGATKYEHVPKAAQAAIREAFKNVLAFSVRDRNTCDFVSALTEKQVWEHLDPVMIANFSEEMHRADLPENLPERYCVVYSYYNRICERQEIEAIQSFCREHKMIPVTVGAPQMWIKDHLVLEPFAALRVIQNAAFVITDTFHGTIFSAKYARKFAVITRASNQNKLRDLISRLGIGEHLIDSFEGLNEAFCAECDTNRVLEIEKTARDLSESYFKEYL